MGLLDCSSQEWSQICVSCVKKRWKKSHIFQGISVSPRVLENEWPQLSLPHSLTPSLPLSSLCLIALFMLSVWSGIGLPVLFPPHVFYCLNWSEMDIGSLCWLDLFHPAWLHYNPDSLFAWIYREELFFFKQWEAECLGVRMYVCMREGERTPGLFLVSFFCERVSSAKLNEVEVTVCSAFTHSLTVSVGVWGCAARLPASATLGRICRTHAACPLTSAAQINTFA